MKAKFFLPFLVTLFVSSSLMAQFHIGFKVGSNITKIDGYAFDDKFNYAYHIGGFAEIGLGQKFGLQPEILFNQYTSSVDSSLSNIYQDIFNNDQYKVKLNYLSVPVLLNYKLLGNFLSLQAGPQFSILTNSDKTLLQNGKEAFKNGDFSMLGGVQLKFSAIRLTGRYAIGLNNISDLGNKSEWKSQGFQVSLGLAL